MRSPTKRGVTQNPKEADQGLREKQPSGRFRKPEGHQTKRSISSKDTKMPKIIKSASSTEKQKLDVLCYPKKDNPTVIKSHEDSHSSQSKLSYKISFWGFLDISSGIENLFEVRGLYSKSKSLIISMNLRSIKNMIQYKDLYSGYVLQMVSDKR
jgi:hypothetical protein